MMGNRQHLDQSIDFAVNKVKVKNGLGMEPIFHLKSA